MYICISKSDQIPKMNFSTFRSYDHHHNFYMYVEYNSIHSTSYSNIFIAVYSLLLCTQFHFKTAIKVNLTL